MHKVGVFVVCNCNREKDHEHCAAVSKKRVYIGPYMIEINSTGLLKRRKIYTTKTSYFQSSNED